MHGSFVSAQLSHDFQQTPGCYSPAPENTQGDALRYSLNKACRAAEQFVDSAECGVTEEADGDCMITVSLWPVRVETKKAAADALMAIMVELMK